MGTNLANGINQALSGVGQTIHTQLSAGTQAASSQGSAAGSTYTNQFSSGIRGIGQRFRSIFNGSVNQAQGAGSDAGQRFHAAFSRGVDRTRESLRTAMQAGGLAAGAAAGAGLLEGMSQEASADRLAAQLGLTSGEQQKFGKIAGALYQKGFGESVADNQITVQAVLSGLPEMRNASQAAVTDVAKKVATISDLTEEEASSVTNSAKQLVTSGLAGSYKEALDVIMKGNQLGLNSSQDLLDTFNEYSPYLGKLGIDAKTSLGIMKQGLAGGARNLDVIGDSWKEFGIRAIDGSDTSVQAYKDLGLNAEKMAAQIGKGGPAAQKATATILERIKKIKDPVEQTAVGVGLFGTQWEDNAQALLATDFSKAAAEVGKVGGAADKAGKTLHDNAKGNIETFYRTLKQRFVEYIGTNVIPQLIKFGGFVKENAGLFKTLGIALVGVVAAAYAYRAALWVVKIAQDALALARFIGNINLAAARQKVIAAATRAWAVAQRLLNAAMSMNPIGLIITGLILLGGALVLAYKKSETFRNIVNAVWASVKSAIYGAWVNNIKPVLSAFWGFLRNTLPPVLRGLWAVVKVVFKGVWTTIKVYWAVISGIFKAIGWTIKNVLAPVFRWLYNNVVKPVFNSVKNHIANTWNNKIKPIFNALKSFVTNSVVPGFRKGINQIGSIWSGLKAMAAKPVNFLIEWVYNKGIRRMINLIPGVKDLKAASPVKFARGGSVTGGTKGKDSVSAMLMPGEHVWTTKEVQAMGGQKNMYALRAAVRNGTFHPGEAQHLAKGGVVNPNERVTWDGEPINRLTAAQLSLAQQLSGQSIRVFQGSWQPATSYSGTSHTGPGVVDTGPGSFSQQYWLRRVGFAAWARNIPGAATAGSGAHVHSVSRLDPGARGHGQLSAFNSGGNGLGGRDYGPNPGLLPGLTNKLSQFGDLSVYGGKGGGGTNWLGLFSKIKDVVSSIRSRVSNGFDKFGPWGGMMANAARSTGNSAIQWVNDKIPNFLLPDNPIPKLFDTGGVLEPGMMAYNASGRPEAVFNHQQFKSFAESAGNAQTMPSSFDMQITNWDKGTGYIRAVARDEVSAADDFNTYRRRMG
ncbi:phage tail tape measure protein [Streptomyces sp. NPDC059513]